MNKLKLKAVELGATEILSREQLTHVMGGIGSYYEEGKSCTGKCYKWEGGASGHMEEGTCSSVVVQIGDKRVETCECSLVGGTSC